MPKSRALVVLVHGFLGGRVQFLPMASMLSAKYDVLNYGYPSRKDTLRGHALQLRDIVADRLQAERKKYGRESRPAVHFVTHSFGGVVLHRAFSDGLADVLPNDGRKSRCILLGPPLRGVSFARLFQPHRIAGPVVMRQAVHAAAQQVMGVNCGSELMTKDGAWFDSEIGRVPNEIAILIIAGQWGTFNPFITHVSDGVVTVQETIMNRRHFRLHVDLTHNLLLWSREVNHCVSTFLDGHPIGQLVDVNCPSCK